MLKLSQAIFGKRFGLLVLILSTQLGFSTRLVRSQDLPPGRSPNSQTESNQICPADLEKSIDSTLNRPQFARSRWGILIQTLNGDRTLYSRDRDRFFIPASNVKLLTTAVALRQLGSQFRIRTSIYQNGTNSVRLVGRGDPSLTDAQLKDLAQQLKRRGYTQLPELIVEEGYFKGPLLHPTWEWEDVQFYYGTQINSLILNQNAVVLTLSPQQIGQPLRAVWGDSIASSQWQIENNAVTTAATESKLIDIGFDLAKPVLRIKGQLPINSTPDISAIAVIDPAKNFLEHLRRALALEGITVKQARVEYSQQRTTVAPEEELAFVESPPLTELVMETNQNSNNVYAETLLRSVGVNKPVASSPQPDSSQNSATMGLATIKQTLTELGVNPDSYLLVDGSGLSRHNLIAPETLVQTLKAIALSPDAAIYKSSLPVAGVSGTLLRRFVNTPAKGIVHAKTGTMTGMSSLSGYVDAPNYQPLVFSIIVNQSDRPVPEIRKAIDEVVVLLTRLQNCRN